MKNKILKKTTIRNTGINKRFATLARYSDQIIIVLSADFIIVDFNTVAERIYNCRRSQVLGKNYFKYFHDHHLQHFTATELKKIMPTKSMRNRPGRILSKKNIEQKVLWTVTCLVEKSSNKKNKEYLLIGQDVTEHEHYQELVKAKRKAEKKLIEKELYLETIIANLPGNVYWKNIEGIYLGCNENAVKAIGMGSRKDFIGKNLYQLQTKY